MLLTRSFWRGEMAVELKWETSNCDSPLGSSRAESSAPAAESAPPTEQNRSGGKAFIQGQRLSRVRISLEEVDTGDSSRMSKMPRSNVRRSAQKPRPVSTSTLPLGFGRSLEEDYSIPAGSGVSIRSTSAYQGFPRRLFRRT